jgi:hypothetical protein
VIVLVVVFFVCASVVFTVIVSPLTAVTSPEVAAAKPAPAFPAPAAPDGRAEGMLLGRVPEDPEPLVDPPGAAPPPPPPKPEAQLPSTAAVMRTVVIAEDEDDEDEDEPEALGVDDAVTHDPTLTAASVALSVAVNLVLDV